MVNGDDATFKRIQCSLGGVTLVPLNTAEFTPAFYTNAEIESLPVRILGVCVELRRKRNEPQAVSQARGFSQQKLAQKLGVSPQHRGDVGVGGQRAEYENDPAHLRSPFYPDFQPFCCASC